MSILEAPSETHLAARQAEGSQNAQCDGAQFENQATVPLEGEDISKFDEVLLMVQKSGDHQLRLVVYRCLSQLRLVVYRCLSHYFTEFYIYIPAGCLGFLNHQQSVWFHIFLKGTNISPSKALWKMIFPFIQVGYGFVIYRWFMGDPP